ncbi:hypothetical protein V6U90_00925 [Micromonospora sp. CPCC 206060]
MGLTALLTRPYRGRVRTPHLTPDEAGAVVDLHLDQLFAGP